MRQGPIHPTILDRVLANSRAHVGTFFRSDFVADPNTYPVFLQVNRISYAVLHILDNTWHCQKCTAYGMEPTISCNIRNSRLCTQYSFRHVFCRPGRSAMRFAVVLWSLRRCFEASQTSSVLRFIFYYLDGRGVRGVDVDCSGIQPPRQPGQGVRHRRLSASGAGHDGARCRVMQA